MYGVHLVCSSVPMTALVRMSGYIGDIHILPDQTQLINPILILTFIPIFNFTYKGIDKCFGKNTVTQLRKISVGMFMAGLAYIVAAAVQGMIDVNLTKSPEISSEMAIRVINVAGDEIYGEFSTKDGVELKDDLKGAFSVDVGEVSPAPGNLNLNSSGEVIIKTNLEENTYFFNDYAYEIEVGKEVWTKAIFPDGNQFDFGSWASKDLDGKNHITVLNALDTGVKFVFTCKSKTCDESSEPIEVELDVCEFENGKLIRNLNETSGEVLDENWPEIKCLKGDPIQGYGVSLWKGEYDVKVMDLEGNVLDKFDENFEVGTGAAYTFTVQKLLDESVKMNALTDITSNDVQNV